MLALLGWNPGNDQELMTMDELINLFSIDKISKAGAKFSLDKAKWFNHEYILGKSAAELHPYFTPALEAHGVHCSDEYVEKVIDLVKDRLNFTGDFWEQACYFFEAPTEYDPQALKKRWKEGTGEKLRVIDQMLQDIKPFDKDKAHDNVMKYIQDNELNMGQVLNSLRIALVGTARGPELFSIIELMGVDEVHRRVERAVEVVNL